MAGRALQGRAELGEARKGMAGKDNQSHSPTQGITATMTANDLNKLAAAKRDASIKMLDLAQRKADHERNVKQRRAGTMAVITAETDANGKPLYTNAEKREAACELRLAEDPSHQADLVAIEAISSELAHTRIAYDFDSDMLRIGLAFAGTHPTVMRGVGEGANADF